MRTPIIQRLPLVFPLGILMTVLYQYSGSIVAPVITHFMVNGGAVLGGVLGMLWLAKTPIISITPLRYTLFVQTLAGSVGLIIYRRKRTIPWEAALPSGERSSQEI